MIKHMKKLTALLALPLLLLPLTGCTSTSNQTDAGCYPGVVKLSGKAIKNGTAAGGSTITVTQAASSCNVDFTNAKRTMTLGVSPTAFSIGNAAQVKKLALYASSTAKAAKDGSFKTTLVLPQLTRNLTIYVGVTSGYKLTCSVKDCPVTSTKINVTAIKLPAPKVKAS
jgi:hypothetical protein